SGDRFASGAELAQALHALDQRQQKTREARSASGGRAKLILALGWAGGFVAAAAVAWMLRFHPGKRGEFNGRQTDGLCRVVTTNAPPIKTNHIAATLVPGFLLRTMYYDVPGDAISQLTGDARFPNESDDVGRAAQLETDSGPKISTGVR